MPIGNVPSGYAKEISRHETEKSVLKTGTTLASAGFSAAQFATGAPNIALLAAGAAASATGIGLVVTGAVLTVATIGASARSAYKTYHHRSHLQDILGRKSCYGCKPWPAYSEDQKEHTKIADEVLPYIISQKGEKLAKKSVGAVGGGILTSVYGMGRAIYKSAAGTKGVKRAEFAGELSHHFMTHNCGLAQAIVAELYSFEEMLWLLEKDTDTATPLFMRKMTST